MPNKKRATYNNKTRSIKTNNKTSKKKTKIMKLMISINRTKKNQMSSSKYHIFQTNVVNIS